jgi:hypothetical protein
MKTKKVEFLLAWEDHTWTTEVVDVPMLFDEDDENGVDFDQFPEAVNGDLVAWANENLALDPFYHSVDSEERVILFAVYALDPQLEEEEEEEEE